MCDNLTPMMAQYQALKEKHPDAVLFFRLGDFYEMFASDASEASRLLDLTLTKRNGVPMCGIPYHAATGYIARLLKAGKKIAICEQISPTRPGKGLVKREVVEVITPGTLLDENLLERTRSNYLISLSRTGKTIALAILEFSRGQLAATHFPQADLAEVLKRELFRLRPSELLIEESLYETEELLPRLFSEYPEMLVNRYPLWNFEPKTNYELICRYFGLANLKAFGLNEDSPEVPALGVIIGYLKDTALKNLPPLRSIELYSDEDYVILDEATQKNLELVRNLQDGSRRYTLYEVLNHTKTAMGARTLQEWLLRPLRDLKAITQRHETVAFFFRHQLLLANCREHLGRILDLERLATRLSSDKAHPKDLIAIKNSLLSCRTLCERLTIETQVGWLGAFVTQPKENLFAQAELIDRAIVEDPALSINEGGIIKGGYSERLDHLRRIRDNAQQILQEYLEEERRQSGLPGLKLRYNRIIGYYFEVPKSQRHHLPEHFILRQSLVGGDRFTTTRLAALESEINNAFEEICELERELFLSVRQTVKQFAQELLLLAQQLAELDVLQSFAYAATLYGYVQPQLTEGTVLEIIEGRHPVVEANLPGGAFVPNSLKLDPENISFVILTGPNMAGKSTVLRQTALIVLLAQVGSFVPAQSVLVGLVDRIFCRVGASDNLARGESTFLTEMNETAFILRRATQRSLIIMDEVGRGTSTVDGLALAWAIILYILEHIGAKTLFATHFHELCQIQHPRLVNLSLAVAEQDRQIIFLKRLKSGPADHSYGIHVAELAGIPEEVIMKAKQIQGQLIKTDTAKAKKISQPQAKEGFTGPTLKQAELFASRELVLTELLNLNIERTTPLKALELLALWQEALKGQEKN